MPKSNRLNEVTQYKIAYVELPSLTQCCPNIICVFNFRWDGTCTPNAVLMSPYKVTGQLHVRP